MRNMERCLCDICDLLVTSNEEQDKYIIENLALLKITMTQEQILQLNNIVDYINNEDAAEKYTAFISGILIGIQLKNN